MAHSAVSPASSQTGLHLSQCEHMSYPTVPPASSKTGQTDLYVSQCEVMPDPTAFSGTGRYFM